MKLFFITSENEITVEGYMKGDDGTVAQYHDVIKPKGNVFDVPYEELSVHKAGEIEVNDDGYIIHAYTDA